MSSADRARASRRRYAGRLRAERRALGLTARGTLPKRVIFVQGDRRRSHRESERRRRARMAAAGLTARGTLRKLNGVGRPANPVEIAWRQLRATMDLPTGAEYLTPSERCCL